MHRDKQRISYIRKPFARKSLVALPSAVAALVCGIVSLALSVRLEGSGGLNVAAWGLSSMIFSVVALVYGILSFLEKEMNQVLAKIAVGIGAFLAVFWVCLVIVGLFG